MGARVQLPPIIYGAADLGALPVVRPFVAARLQAQRRLLDELESKGMGAIDTAAVYQLGGSERLLGMWFATRRTTTPMAVISKACHPWPPLMRSRLSANAVRIDLAGSLRRLGVPKIDVYMLHRTDVDDVPLGVIEALTAAIDEGRIASWGVSNISFGTLRRLLATCRARGYLLPSVVSNHDSLFEWQRAAWPGCVSIAGPERKAWLTLFADHALTHMPWSPVGRGFLRAEISGDGAVVDGSISRHSRQVYGSQANGRRLARLRQLAAAKQVSAGALALAYLRSSYERTHPVCSTTSAERFSENLSGALVPLSVDDLRWLEDGETVSSRGSVGMEAGA